MIQAALITALGCGVISALAGNRTAWILLASAAFCLVLDWKEVAFIPVMWMMFDLVAVWFIFREKMTVADTVIIALFIPAWVFYLLPDDQRYLGSMLVTIAQLLLTFPAANTWKLIKRISPVPDNRDDFNPRAVHAGVY